MKLLKSAAVIILVLFVLTSARSGLPEDTNEYIRKRVEDLNAGSEVIIRSDKIHCQVTLPLFYHRRGFEPAWLKEDKEQLLEILADAGSEGLNPEDYHFSTLSQFKKPTTEIEVAELDMLLTDAFLLYASHFLNGKVNPETVDSEWKAIRREGNALESLENSLNTDNIKYSLEALEPKHQSYLKLKRALKYYEDIKARGGWNIIPTGETIKPGAIDSLRVPLLAARLVISQDLKEMPEEPYIFSDKLVEATKKFQIRNGLDIDGSIGKATLTALNRSADEIIDLIKINMERYRWISQELGKRYIMVNIADYQMKMFQDDSLVYDEKVIVGKPFRKTPVFSSKMTYLVLNPYWTVPPTILFNDILPEVKKNPGYLISKNIKVLEGSGSTTIVRDPYTIDWSSLSASRFPYTLRQDPGPTNALGQVKFMFPNTYNVYIHDTPSKELFVRADRAFSSGCIRLNKPMNFVYFLLKDNPKWNKPQVEKILKQGADTSIILDKPVNVHILYLTCWIDGGEIHFRNDPYNRDAPLLKALNEGPPSI